ncbi:hypothetical protein C8R43DRAFT_955205 [Mycena crocata]|nr:hypothetical protein C8R43DRAFT_955205 [Mycena crocata]
MPQSFALDEPMLVDRKPSSLSAQRPERRKTMPAKSAAEPIRLQDILPQQTASAQPASLHRSRQTARKSTGGKAPSLIKPNKNHESKPKNSKSKPTHKTTTEVPSSLDSSSQRQLHGRDQTESHGAGTGSLHSIPVQNLIPPIPCFLCPASRFVDTDPVIHEFKTVCHHRFHYNCYMAFITTASKSQHAVCPECHANLLTHGKYWVSCTTTDGHQNRLNTAHTAREHIFIDSLLRLNFPMAVFLLTGPDAVDVSFKSDLGGLTPLHFCAMYSNLSAIDFLLSYGADKARQDNTGLLPIDMARLHNAWEVVVHRLS